MAAATAGMSRAAAGAGAGAAGRSEASDAGDAGAEPTQDNQRIPCEAADVLGRQCLSCHGETLNLGAPMHLVTWADLHAPAPSDPSKKVFELVSVRVQDSERPMPPKMNGKIAAADRTALASWCDQGAPASPNGAAECP